MSNRELAPSFLKSINGAGHALADSYESTALCRAMLGANHARFGRPDAGAMGLTRAKSEAQPIACHQIGATRAARLSLFRRGAPLETTAKTISAVLHPTVDQKESIVAFIEKRPPKGR